MRAAHRRPRGRIQGRLSRPRVRIKAIAVAMRDPEIDLRPWAAYTLGYQGHALRYWQVLIWDLPNYEHADGVPCSSAELRYALDILTAEIPLGVALALREVLGRLERIHEQIIQCLLDGTRYRGRRLGWGEAPGRAGWERMTCLVGQALADGAPSHRWLRLGQELGIWMHEDLLGDGARARAESLRVAHAGLKLTAQARARFPVLESLGRLAADPGCVDEPYLRRKLIEAAPELWPDDFLDPVRDEWAYSKVMRLLHRDIQQQLLRNRRLPDAGCEHGSPGDCDEEGSPQAHRLVSPFAAETVEAAVIVPSNGTEVGPTARQNPATETVRPRWDSECGELRYQGDVIRRVRSRSVARSIVRVLDAFEEDGWPRRIDNPVGNDKIKIHETIKSLNDGLTRIRFHGDGVGEGIIWRPFES